jgi:hypothetical protein
LNTKKTMTYDGVVVRGGCAVQICAMSIL